MSDEDRLTLRAIIDEAGPEIGSEPINPARTPRRIVYPIDREAPRSPVMAGSLPLTTTMTTSGAFSHGIARTRHADQCDGHDHPGDRCSGLGPVQPPAGIGSCLWLLVMFKLVTPPVVPVSVPMPVSISTAMPIAVKADPVVYEDLAKPTRDVDEAELPSLSGRTAICHRLRGKSISFNRGNPPASIGSLVLGTCGAGLGAVGRDRLVDAGYATDRPVPMGAMRFAADSRRLARSD